MATSPVVLTPPRTQTRWTYHDLDRLPDELERYELWEGELIMSPSPTMAHQEIVMRLIKRFVLHDPDNERGQYLTAPADVVLRENITVQPDVFWIASGRTDIIAHERVMGAPDLCIEVLSRSSIEADQERKPRYYADAGVREYWLLDPVAQTVTVYALGSNTHTVYQSGATVTSALPELEGLSLDVAGVFKELP